MKRRFTILSAALALLVSLAIPMGVWGQTTVTYTLATTTSVTTSGTAPTGSQASFSQTYGTMCQMTSGNSQTLTLSGYSGYTVTNITLSMKSNKKGGAGKLSYSIDGGQSYTYIVGDANSGVAFNHSDWNGNWSTSYVDISKDVHIAPTSSSFIIKIEATVNSLYCQSYTLTYSSSGSAPTCTVDPESWDFGSLQVGSSAQTKTFTVTTANLEHGMSFYLDNSDYFSITNSQPGFPATTTTYEITVSFNPTSVGTHTATLILEGDDFENDIEVPLTATVVSNDPTCTINPTTWEFGNVAIGMSATKEFTVTTTNLAGDLTLAMSESVYSVTPTTIAQNATTTTVTISFTPTEAGEVYDELSIIGGGLGSATTAIVSGTGYQAQTYTITFDAGSGTCTTETMTGVSGSTITLPTAVPSQACQDAGWTFAGWATTSVDETTTAPTLLSGSYTISSNVTLCAVYKHGTAPFDNTASGVYMIYASVDNTNYYATTLSNKKIQSSSDIDEAASFEFIKKEGTGVYAIKMGSKYLGHTSGKTDMVLQDDEFTWTISSSAENGSWRITSNLSNNRGLIFQDHTVSSGVTTYTHLFGAYATSNVDGDDYFDVEIGGGGSITYDSNPDCLEKVATPTFDPEDGTIFYEDELEVTISCTTEDATIYYTLDGSVPTNESSVYNGTITLTETTTVKAIAMKEGMADSEIAEATYTQLPLSTIAEVRAQGTGSVITKGIVTHMSGVTAYIQDETAAIVVYGSDVPAVGDEIRVSGTLTTYNGLLEIGSNNNPPTITVLSQGHSVEPTVMTIEAINTDAAGNNAYQAKLVRIENATYNNGTVSQGDNSITVYGTMAGVNDGNIVSFTGNIGCYNSVQIVNPTDIIVSYTLTIPAFYDTQNGGYRLISSPIGTVAPTQVTNMITDDDDNNNRTYDLYRFDQAQELEWRNYRNNDGGHFNLEFGKGYLYGNLSDVELVFTGTAYNGDAKVTLTKTDNTSADFPGWNLVGNPFGVNAYIGNRDFYVMEAGSEIILADRVQDGAEYIKPMEGVFVIAANNGEELQFTTTPNGKSSRLGLNLSNGRNVIDRASVRFDEGQQLPKFQLNRNSTKVYIPQDGKDFAVVCAEEMGAMPVNFKAEDNGTYSLNFNSENVEFSYLHLIDNMTGNDVDLLQTPSYSFEAKTTDYESRFKLVFATGDNSNDDTFAFYSNGSFVINNEGNATLQVIDVTGRIVKSESVNGCTNVNVNAAPGVYMLRLINGDNVKTQKVVVK